MPYSYNNQWHHDPCSRDGCADFFCYFSEKCGEFPTEVWEAHHLQASVNLLSYSQSKGQAHRTKRKRLAAVTGTIKNIVSPILEQAKDTIAKLHRTANCLLAVEVCGWDYSCCLWNRAFVFYGPTKWLSVSSASCFGIFPFQSPGERTKQ